MLTQQLVQRQLLKKPAVRLSKAFVSYGHHSVRSDGLKQKRDRLIKLGSYEMIILSDQVGQ